MSKPPSQQETFQQRQRMFQGKIDESLAKELHEEEISGAQQKVRSRKNEQTEERETDSEMARRLQQEEEDLKLAKRLQEEERRGISPKSSAPFAGSPRSSDPRY